MTHYTPLYSKINICLYYLLRVYKLNHSFALLKHNDKMIRSVLFDQIYLYL